MKRSASTIATEPWANATAVRPAGRGLSRAADPRSRAPTIGRRSTTARRDLAEYLNYAGYNAAAINVMADGGSLFPKTLLDTSPHADIRPIGVDADLPTADGLELMLRVFDRADWPWCRRSSSTSRCRNSNRSASVRSPRPPASSWSVPADTPGSRPTARDTRSHAALQPARRPRAAGHARRGSPDRCSATADIRRSPRWRCSSRAAATAMLPGLEWGLDDTTIEHFEHDTGIRCERRWSRSLRSAPKLAHRRARRRLAGLAGGSRHRVL